MFDVVGRFRYIKPNDVVIKICDILIIIMWKTYIKILVTPYIYYRYIRIESYHSDTSIFLAVCDKKVCITGMCNMENGTTFSFILQGYLRFL